MSDCCSTNNSATGTTTRSSRHRCPVHGQSCPPVSRTTVLHHLRQPWQVTLTEQLYYFCDDPECAVVYFGADDSTIRQDAVRTTVGAKSQDDEALLCYCFGVSRAEARDHQAAKDFVVEQTRLGACACETRNPSGRCCLKDFPRARQSVAKAT